MSQFVATIYTGVNPQGSIQEFADWPEFVGWLKTESCRRVETKKGGLSFSPLAFRGGYRSSENGVGQKYHAVVLDLDKVFDAKAMFRVVRPYEYFAYTTWTSTPEEERWRIILPLAKPVEHSEMVKILDSITHRLGKAAQVDRCSYSEARLWFAMHYRTSRPQEHWNHGRLISGPQNIIQVDFTGVQSSVVPEKILEGERNNLLASYLRQQLFVTCTEVELRKAALEWNKKLPSPLPHKEVVNTARGAWRWWTGDPEGLERRRLGMRAIQAQMEFSANSWAATANAKDEQPLVGDHYLYPGLTVLSGKAKSGKTRFLWDLLIAFSNGSTFMKSATFAGFRVKPTQCAILAIEDTPFSLKIRGLHKIARGVTVYLQKDIEKIQEMGRTSGLDGFEVIERMIDHLYKEGIRVLAIDPLSLLEAILHLGCYPGGDQSDNIHSQEFVRIRYFQRLCDMYGDLSIILVFHHGKNRTGKDLMDPQDMIAGTSGIHAAAVNIMALVRPPHREDLDPKTNPHVLYMGGRLSPTGLYEMAMNDKGEWVCNGEWVHEVKEKTLSVRDRIIQTIIEKVGVGKVISSQTLSEEMGIAVVTVMKNISRVEDPTFKIVAVLGRHGGYKVVRKESKDAKVHL